MKLPMSVYGTPGAKGDTGAGVPNGGTTGQQLAKASNTDQDTAWVDPGLPGSGTIGQVAYYGADNVLAGSDNLKWDEATKTLTLATGNLLAGVSGAFGTVDQFTDLGAVPVVGILADPNVNTLGLLIAQEVWNTSGDPNSPMLAVVAKSNPVVAFFKNQDDSGNSDLVSIGFRCFESAIIGPTGFLEYQSSGLGDGTSFYDFNFGNGSVITAFASDGGIVPGTDNASDLGAASSPIFGAGNTLRWRTGYFGTSVVIGDTPFTFSETAGVLAYGTPMVTWDSNAFTLTVGDGSMNVFGIQGSAGIGFFINGPVFQQIFMAADGSLNMNNAVGNASLGMAADGSFSLFAAGGAGLTDSVAGDWAISGNSFSASGATISGSFQTSITDGSNANATVVVKGNTAQTAALQEWRGTDGTTVLASMDINGIADAAGYRAGGFSGIDFDGPVTNITVVKGIVTAAS